MAIGESWLPINLNIVFISGLWARKMDGITLEKINENLNSLGMDIMELRARLEEEYELSEEAKKDLAEAREAMSKHSVRYERIMEKFGQPS